MAVPTNPRKAECNAHLKVENENHLEEWKKARDAMQDFDDNLHDLRKYGFSFLTLLLGAEAVLIPTSDMPALVKFAVFAVTLLLIAAIYLLDTNYRLFQKAVNTRARVLERKLNLELSEAISVRHGLNKINKIVRSVYYIFIGGVVLLGGCVLEPEWWYVGLLAGFGLAIAIVPRTMVHLRFWNKGFDEDWTVSPLECNRDEPIIITLNNLSSHHKPIVFKQGAPIWTLKDIYGTEVYTEKPERDIVVSDTCTWTRKPEEFPGGRLEKGVYQLQPRGWHIPLPVSLIVLD